MRIAFESLPLPADVAVALVEGERESTLVLNERASVADIAASLTELVGQWAGEEWIYVGRALESHLRAA